MTDPEGEGRIIDVATLTAMVLTDRDLSQLARGSVIYVFAGGLDDPTSVTGWHFGEFLRFDADRRVVVYRTMPAPPPSITQTKLTGGAVLLTRATVTDPTSGLLLPMGTRESMPEENSVSLDESYFVVDGGKYAAFMSEPPTQGGLY